MRKETVLALAILLLIAGSLNQTKAMLESSFVIGAYGSVYHDPDQNSVSLVVALDGSGNFTDIQDAIDAVPPDTFGYITVKAGTYTLNPQYHYPYKTIILKSNINLRGEGIDQTVIKSFPDKQPVGGNIRANAMTGGTIENVLVEDLTVIQNGSPDNQGYGGIRLGTCTNVTVRNIKITDVTGEALSFSGTAKVENCIIDRVWTGICIRAGNGSIIRGNRVYNTGGDAIFPQPIGGTVNDCWIEGNYLENITDTGIDITGSTTIDPITGAKISQYRHNNITAIGNTLINGSIRVSGADNIHLLNNRIFRGYVGIDPGALHPINVEVRGNWIEDFGLVGKASEHGIGGNGYYVVIDSNTIFSYRPEALWAVNTWGSWNVTNNALLVPGKSGNAAANSRGRVQGNFAYVP